MMRIKKAVQMIIDKEIDEISNYQTRINIRFFQKPNNQDR